MKQGQVWMLIGFSFFLFSGYFCFAKGAPNAHESHSETRIEKRKKVKKTEKGKQVKITCKKRVKPHREDALQAQSRVPNHPTEPSRQARPRAGGTLGLQTPTLPAPFYGETESYGNRHTMALGVETSDGPTYSVHAEEESTESHVRRSMGGSLTVPLEKVERFFKGTWSMITFVPKHIGRGVSCCFKGVRGLF